MHKSQQAKNSGEFLRGPMARSRGIAVLVERPLSGAFRKSCGKQKHLPARETNNIWYHGAVSRHGQTKPF